MACWIFCLFTFTLMFTTIGGANFDMKNSDNYGPFTVEWKNCNTCRGPKSLNMTTYTRTLVVEPNGTYRYLLNITFIENVHIDEIKVKVYTVKNNKKTIMWNANINKPCSHYMMAAFLESYFDVINCWVKKASTYFLTKYTLKVVSII
ncbi:jg27574 [Pararge aegeria aegeria]|uniref:Jg27574 protein n=1 Tax=Pararge aegeria aegeria TaxID=348720 RepID=A0A8S4SJF7_9NEOP|nr:jg27574 [Pararge aegeria aegeria]